MSNRPHDINDLLKDLHEQIDWYIDRIEELGHYNQSLANDFQKFYDSIPWEEIERMSAGWYTSDSATGLGTDHNSHCSSRQLTSAQCDCERGMIRRILALREQEGMSDTPTSNSLTVTTELLPGRESE